MNSPQPLLKPLNHLYSNFLATCTQSPCLIYPYISALRYLSLKSESEQPRPEHQPLTGTAVFEVARRILEGSHAIPTRLKILLDRAMNNLSEDEKRLILSSCLWNIEDYTRGYKLKVNYQHYRKTKLFILQTNLSFVKDINLTWVKIFCSNIIIITYWIIVIIVINNNFPHLFTNDLYVEFIFLARELKPANIQGLWLMKVRVRKWLFITRQFLNSFRQLLPNPPPSIKKRNQL